MPKTNHDPFKNLLTGFLCIPKLPKFMPLKCLIINFDLYNSISRQKVSNYFLFDILRCLFSLFPFRVKLCQQLTTYHVDNPPHNYLKHVLCRVVAQPNFYSSSTAQCLINELLDQAKEKCFPRRQIHVEQCCTITSMKSPFTIFISFRNVVHFVYTIAKFSEPENINKSHGAYFFIRQKKINFQLCM